MEKGAIILFDGVCNLCNQSVQFVLPRDREGYFSFASLQSDTGASILTENGYSADFLGSFMLYEDGKLYKQSTAALRVARKLGFPWTLSAVFYIVPPFLRNLVYDFIARNRYKWFGKTDECWLPRPEWSSRFIT